MEQNKFYQIKNVTEHEYTLVGCDGSVIIRPIQDVDKSASIFTIQDAKDGDVLTTDIWTFIFKKYQDKSVYYHFANSTFNDFSISDTSEFDTYYVHPATKEQRETLIKAMADAGYIFDFEQKELKKIEHNPTTKLEYDENGEPILTPFESELFSVISEVWQGYLLGEEVNIAKIVKEHSEELLERANEQNPVVYDKDAEKASEEYRNFRMSCGIKNPVMLNEIEEAYYEGTIRKQKPAETQTENSPAWSEEDENITCFLIDVAENYRIRNGFSSVLAQGDKAIDWLNSLREKYTWKPSDEQMTQLKRCCPDNRPLTSLYEQLKKLREE